MLTTMIGMIAATCTTIAFIPQVVHTLRSRDTSGISMGMYVTFTLGVFFWLIYGVLLSEWPIIIGNTITLCLASIVLLMKIKHG